MEACLIFSSFATKDLNLQEILFYRGYSNFLATCFSFEIKETFQRLRLKRFKACFRTDVAVCNV